MGAASSSESRPLDMLERLAIAYLALPLPIFFLGWFSTWAGLALTALFLIAVLPLVMNRGRPPAASPSIPIVLVSLVIAVGWSLLGGAGHFVYANSDWPIRDAVLRDLVVSNWPPSYGTVDGADLILRTPLAYYLPAALLAKVAGLESADFLLFLWTAIGVALFLAVALSKACTPRHTIIAIAVIVLFSGMDVFGTDRYFLNRPPLTQHLEWWAQLFQYSSNSTQLFWVPNHALPGWLMSILIYKHWRNPEFLKVSPIAFAATALWSPLVTIGLAPFALLILEHNVRNNTWRSCALFVSLPGAIATFGITAYYLTIDSGGIRSGAALGAVSSVDGFVMLYLKFVLLEFGFIAAGLWLLIKPNALMMVAVAILLVLPFYRFGPGNDLVMRGSIPALMILCLLAVDALVQVDWKSHTKFVMPLLFCLTFGSITAVHEIARSLLVARWPAQLHRNLIEVSRGAPTHYVARLTPLLGKLLRSPGRVPGLYLER